LETLKIALIGCGKQAPKHISGLRKIPGVELVLADINPHYAEQLGAQQGLAWRPQVEDIFADPALKAVDICTPTASHAELISRAVAAGKDFFCEKPLCASLQEAQTIVEHLETSQRKGMVGYVYRFSPVFEMGRSFFEDVPFGGESKVLGKVVSAFFRLGGRGGHQPWKHLKAHGGGAINEMLVHMIDLALWYLGPAATAQVLASDLLRARRPVAGKMTAVDAEDYVLVRLKTQSGVEVLCQADLITPVFTNLVEIQGENGTFMASIQPEMPSFLFCQEGAAGYPAGKTPLKFGPLNLFEAQMAEFVHMVRWQKEPSRCTMQDSLRLLETLELLNQN
jgi:myo-inositol 2-dehydrogenase/D-chiro-inositol 1-dehydrogenase